MNFLKYLKENIIKIVYIFSMFIIVNTIFITTKYINGYGDLFYLNILMIFLSTVYICAEYLSFKKNYYELYNAVSDNMDFDNIELDTDRIIPNLIKNIINIKNIEKTEDVLEIKENLSSLNDYITLWIHEAKLPLSVLELISEQIDDLEAYSISKDLRIEVEKMNFLINQVLYASRITDFSKDLHITEVNLNEAVNYAIKENRNILISKNISINVDKINSSVFTDKKWVSFVVNQIINNSAKYTGEHGIISIYFKEYSNKIDLIVEDNGIGISESDINRIFDKSFTGKAGSNFQKSTGMGLYLCEKISRNLNFKISVQSEEGVYTKFTVSFNKMNPYFNVTKM